MEQNENTESHQPKETHTVNETHHSNSHENHVKPKKHENFGSWYDQHYKRMLLIPIILLVLSLGYLGYFYSQNNDFFLKDASLAGGSTITIFENIDDLTQESIESGLKTQFPDILVRKLTDLTTGNINAYIIETSAESDVLKLALEEFLGYPLDANNSTIEFTGPSLSKSFYQQLIIALIISFVLMSIAIFVIFRTFIPSIAVIFAAFSDIIMPLALINILGIRLSAAGIAAFLMLIGYSVDTDVLLTTRAIRTKGGTINSRILRAFKTGSFMTSTAIVAVLPAFLIVSSLPDTFRQIFLILSIGLFADLINTWLGNASIIKWYCERKKIQ
ncbi:protein translocase subunit SecF [Candidatus Pacearchaeota archaeon]|nr:protein translocase subunit SecF [Candidatus Pacearchaeota archaeon]